MTDYERWLMEVEREYARYGEVDVVPTVYGAAVYDAASRAFIADEHYERDPHAEERVRY